MAGSSYYQQIFEQGSHLTSVEQTLPGSSQSLMRCAHGDHIWVFEHVAQTGGANVNDFLFRQIGNPAFLIPSFEDVWADERTAIPYQPSHEVRCISAHYLNGVEIPERTKRVFTFCRDPRRLVLSALQDAPHSSHKELFSAVEARLTHQLRTVGHLSYQLYELATPSSKKLFPYVHGGTSPLFNPLNLQGTNPNQLLEIVQERQSNSIRFFGITELFSESIFLLSEILGFANVQLWRPGLFSYRKFSYEEFPVVVQSLVEELTLVESQWYSGLLSQIHDLVKNSKNAAQIFEYCLQNRRVVTKFLQNAQERLELALATNSGENQSLKAEVEFFERVLLDLTELTNRFRMNMN